MIAAIPFRKPDSMNTPGPGSNGDLLQPTTHRHYVAIVAFCAVASVAYLSRNCLGVFAADERFQKELGATEQQLSVVMSSFLLAYAICQIPAGWLGMKLGSRVVLSLFAASWSICTMGMALGSTIVALCVAQAAIGMTQAGVFPNAARSIADWVPIRNRALACGLMASFMSIGGAAAGALTGFLAESGYSWRHVAVLYGFPGLTWAAAFFFWFRDRPEEHRGVNSSELAGIREVEPTELTQPTDEATTTAPTDWGRVLKSRALWLINAQQFFRAAGYIFYATWFPKFLRETRGVSLEEAGYLSSLPLLAVVAGCTFGGWLCDYLFRKTKSRKISRRMVASVCLMSCGLLTVSALLPTTTEAAMALITAGSFFAAIAGPCSYAQTIDLAGPRIPVIFGTMNMVGNLGAAVCPPLVTGIVALTGAWEPVLALFFVIYIAAAVCWMFLDVDASIDDRSESQAPS